MAELGFVIKSFILTCALVFCLQLKVGGQSVDSQIFGALHNSRASGWLQDMGYGAVRVTASAFNSVANSQMVKGKIPFLSQVHLAEDAKKTFEHREEAIEKALGEIGEYPVSTVKED